MRLIRLLCLAGAVLLGSLAANSQEMRSLNEGWLFCLSESAPDAPQGISPKSELAPREQWHAVNLPHTWNTDVYSVKAYHQGTGWYTRQLDIPAAWQGKRIFLRFEGAGKTATVFVNGQQVTEHKGGYTAFSADISPYLKAEGNTLSVRVTNSAWDVPPISADFTFFGGIYRDVWLIATDNVHISRTDMGADALYITTPEVSEEQATVAVRTTLCNDSPGPARLQLVATLHKPDGSVLQTFSQNVKMDAGAQATVSLQSKPVASPELWSPESPVLYPLTVEVRDRRSGEVLDRMEKYTAFRYYSLTGDGFTLNGKPYKLRGQNRHQDRMPYGPAISDEAHRHDIRMMKDMGANFIRISHYPQDPAILEMCDRMGLLVWEEVPVINFVPDTPGYYENAESALREMIRQHYNHPSVIMWGYMNEILLVWQWIYPDPDEKQAGLERCLELARLLEAVVHEEDPTRTSTMALNQGTINNETGMNMIAHVEGWNLYSGWYTGELNEFEEFVYQQHRDYPTHPIIISEYGAGSDKRLHSLEPRKFDFSTEYQQTFLEHYVRVIEEAPFLCGGSHWNFIDFSVGDRQESMPRINNKGLLRADRSVKDVYYYFKAMWRDDAPVLHIASRDWNVRCAVSDDGTAVMPVKVYTNLPEVELFADGVSLGVKAVENCHAVFDVPFAGDGVYLQACAESNGTKVYDGLRLQFSTVPRTLSGGLGTVELAVNVGSNCFFTSDESSLTWVPDQAYEPGSWGHIGGETASTTTEIFLSPDDPLFQTQQRGIEGYRFDVPAGRYELELGFADYSQAGNTTVGGVMASPDNVFDIVCNGSVLEAAFAPAAANGTFSAQRLKYVVTVEDAAQGLQLQLRPVSGQTHLSTIKLRQL